jgi:hypothetical protein
MITHSPRRSRGPLALLLTVLLAAVALVALPASRSHAAVIDTSASYVLVNRHSGKAMAVSNADTADGASIVQWSRDDGAWQQWRFVDADFATTSVPIVEPPPARLSTMTDCPSRSDNPFATMRPTASVPPPAENGSTMRIDRSG